MSGAVQLPSLFMRVGAPWLRMYIFLSMAQSSISSLAWSVISGRSHDPCALASAQVLLHLSVGQICSWGRTSLRSKPPFAGGDRCPHRIESNFADRTHFPQGHLVGSAFVSMSQEVKRMCHWYAGLPGRFAKNTAAGGSR